MTDMILAPDLSDFDSLDTADLDVRPPGAGPEFQWRITFAGPGHKLTVAMNERNARKRIREDREKEQARTNGRKWKGDEKTPEDVRNENISLIVDRIVTWTDVRIGGEIVPFSREVAMQLFTDPRRGWLFDQALEFIIADATFTKRSATTY